MGRSTAKWLTPALLIFGVELWLNLGEGDYGRGYKPLLVAAAIVAGFIRPINRRFNRVWNWVSNPSPWVRTWIALGIAVGSALFLLWTERMQGIEFKPKYQDEFSYLIQMRMLSHGRLWMPGLPLPEFFDSFYILVKPVYASMYFPGAAMMFLPALLLRLPYWAGTLAVAGICAGMLFLVLAEVLDGVLGILGVMLLLSLPWFRLMSIMVMSQIPMLLLGLVMTWAALKWRKNRGRGWLLLLGAAMGWAAITRPMDAVCFVIVVGIAMAMDLWGKRWKEWITTAALIVVPALPFLVLQLGLNRGVTGNWMKSPFAEYNDAIYPGAMGFHGGDAPEHVSDIPEVQYFYEIKVRPLLKEHRVENVFGIGLKDEWNFVRTVAIADPYLWVIAPLSLVAMWDRRRWMVWGMLPVFFGVMSIYAFSWDLPHYFIMVMPATILLAVLPIRFLTNAFPGKEATIRTMMGLGIAVIVITDLPQFNRVVHDQPFVYAELDRIDNDLATIPERAVVLFHFNRDALVDGKKVTNNPSEEPVFNADVVWPDDATIVRARDLNGDVAEVGKPGDRDRALYEYYSRIAPGRVIYLYNRGAESGRLTRLGTADELLGETAGPK